MSVSWAERTSLSAPPCAWLRWSRPRVYFTNHCALGGHAVGWGVEAAQQNEQHHHEEREQHGLLCVGQRGDQQAEAEHGNEINSGKGIDGEELPTGMMPYTTHDMPNPMVSMMLPSTQNGMSLPSMNWYFLMGVTLICSMVPTSFLSRCWARRETHPPWWRAARVCRDHEEAIVHERVEPVDAWDLDHGLRVLPRQLHPV